MHQQFETPDPLQVFLTFGAGRVTVTATDLLTTEVEATGQDADELTVELRGRELHVLGPSRRGGLFSSHGGITLDLRVPTGSRLTTKLGSADLTCTGELAETALKAGSGTVRVERVSGDATVETGSGDVTLSSVGGDLRAATGSGEISLGSVHGASILTTGSGDVRVESADGELTARTGSGSLRIGEAGSDLTLRSGSGEIDIESVVRGQVVARTGSGDVRVGVGVGVPVWTDLHSGSGQVRSDLAGVGEPRDGQEFVELRATTGSGSIRLEQR